MHPLGVGAALGDRYRLERRIATGGMATIWLGRDRKLSRPVAVKILSDVLAEDPAYVARFRREARLAAGLSHANLVQVYDFSGESERPYLVMEYVGEGTLADRIEAGRPGGVDARRLAHELLGALDCIHGAGVVHRDVKPSNVLIDRECRARLTDFGIAQTADATRITRTGEVVGTLTYMAPEVRAGSPATERSDLYSLGVLLDECRAGDIGPQVARLVERLVQADPAERPASARHALTLLETAPEPAPRAAPAAMPPSARRSRVVELNGRRVATVVAALGLAAILVAVAIGGGQSGTDRARTGEVQPRRSTTTTTTTSVVTTTSTVAPTPAAAPKPEPKSPGEKPPKPEGTQPKGEKVPPGQEKRGGD
jgi:serine/threonine-protein kinase